MTIAEFVNRWKDSQASEKANAQSFLNDLCASLCVPPPRPAKNDGTDEYVFERRVSLPHEEKATVGFIDLYKRGAFVLEGRVEHIHLAGRAGEPMRAIDRIRVNAGIGLDGDRYATGLGRYSKDPGTGRALTLIEAEVLDSLRASLGIDLQPGEARRNVTTRGIALNALVGQRFRIGGVLCEATRLCEPCKYLEDLIVKPVLHPLLHRGGLRADVLEDGEIRIGDEVRPV